MFFYVCVVVLLICLYPWWRYRRARRLLEDLPCLPSLPVVGNLHQLMGDGVHILTRLTIVSKTMEYQRSPLVFWMGPVPLLGICDPPDVNAVINAFINKSNVIRVSRSVKDCQDIFNTQAQKLVAQLKMEVGKESFDASQKYIACMVFETFCEVIFGKPRSGLTKEDYQAIRRISELYLGRSINVPFLLGFLYGIAPTTKQMIKDEELLRRFVEKTMTQTRNSDATTKPFLQRKIAEDLATMIGAGHQILANALTMCLLMIGNYSAVQDKLYAEINKVLGDTNRPITKEDLAKMQFCEAVIRETLRLYPFIPLYFFHADVDLELRKCTVPKNTVCWINIWGAGRCRNDWGADTDVFRPERWMESNHHDTLMTLYLDNLAGLGIEDSIAMLKTTLAYCVRELLIQSNIRNLRFKMSTALLPINGHLIRVHARD